MRWLVLYYSATGQTKRALDEVTAPLVGAGHDVMWRAIEPIEAYPFPWPQRRFWGVAPECKRAFGCAIQPLDLPEPADVDAVLLGSQPWFLAPAPPVMGFLNAPEAEILRGKPVYPVITCRAAWRQAYRILRIAVIAHGGQIPARLVLKDRAPTPINIVTTVHYLWWGSEVRDRPFGAIWPRFGISQSGWQRARLFGEGLTRISGRQNWLL